MGIFGVKTGGEGLKMGFWGLELGGEPQKWPFFKGKMAQNVDFGAWDGGGSP